MYYNIRGRTSKAARQRARQRRMKKLNNVFASFNPVEDTNLSDDWQIIYHKNMIKLAFMVLFYVYSNDDQRISRSERKRIKKLRKLEEMHLNNEDKKEINKLACKPMSLRSFLAYINKHEYKESIFNDACQIASSIIDDNYTYLKILNKLKEEFNTSKFY